MKHQWGKFRMDIRKRFFTEREGGHSSGSWHELSAPGFSFRRSHIVRASLRLPGTARAAATVTTCVAHAAPRVEALHRDLVKLEGNHQT